MHVFSVAQQRTMIEKGMIAGVGKGDVMDAFLTHACHEINQMTKDLVQMVINFRSVEKKQKAIYSEKIIQAMSEFPPKNVSFSVLFQTFSSLASNSIPNVISTLNAFFPSVICHLKEYETTSKSLLHFFPSFQTQGEEMELVIGFISEASFAAFLQSLLDKITDIKDTEATNILDRIFSICERPQLNQLQMEVTKISLDRYYGVLKRITQQRLGDFAIHFSHTFPTKKSTPQYIILYMHAIRGIAFGEHNYSKIKDTFQLIPKIMKAFESNGEVVNSICLSLCCIVPQLKNLQQDEFLKVLEHRANKVLKDKVAWASALKLIGVIHYVLPPQFTPKYSKFIESFVFNRFKKPHKINAALDYVIAYLRPTEECVYNWSPQTGEFIRLVFQHLFSVNLQGHEMKTSLILEHIAALDLPTFTNEWLPQLLKQNSEYGAIALLTVQRILNPMSRFQELAKAIPTNAATGIHRQVQSIIAFVKEFIIARFAKFEHVNTNFLINIQNVDEILLELDIPPDLAKINLMEFPSAVLLYLLKWREFSPLTTLSQTTKTQIDQANKTCEKLMEQWVTTFDTPHNSFGDLLEKDTLTTLGTETFTDSIDLDILPVLPILFCYSTDYTELLTPLFALMVSKDPYIAAQANVIFQLVFIAFQNKAFFFLEQLIAFIQETISVSACQIHQLVQAYYYCLLISKGQYSSFPEEILSELDFVVFTSLCVPFPETHTISFQIIDLSRLMKHLVPNSINRKSISDVFDQKSSIIEQRIIITIISEYSTWSESTCPFYRMPTISLKNAALSKYHLLWRFALVQLTEAMVSYQLTPIIIALRNSYLKFSNVIESESFCRKDKYNISMFSNILTFVFSSSTTCPETSNSKQRKEWANQIQKIDALISTATSAALTLNRDELRIFSFVFTALNIVALAKAISSFLKTLTSSDVKLLQKEDALSVFATMLRHVAMQVSFDDYAAKMCHSGQIRAILSIFDTSLQIFVKVRGVDHYIQLFHQLEQFSHFLVFRGQYFRFLHQSRIETPHCPVPRCALTSYVDDSDISPRCSIQELFNLLFDWSMIGIEGYKNADLEAALLIDQNPPDKQQLLGLGHAARVTLSFLVPLKQIFTDEKEFTPEFMERVSIIAKERPSFLKHLLTKHLPLLLEKFAERALTAELDAGTSFLNAIAAQFIPPTVKDSMIYSHNTFLKNMSTTTPGKLSDYDKKFIELVYGKTGLLLLVGLFYLMHNNVTIRQNSMRMIGQVFPVICLFHNKGETETTSEFLSVISRLINNISTQNTTLRVQNAVELSTYCSKAFKFCTEQILFYAFQALPSAYLNRRVLSRECLLQIISPWMSDIVFDLKNRMILAQPSKFFIYFSPYSFVSSFVSIMTHITPYTLLLPLWQKIILESPEQDANTKFLTIALIDIAISRPDTRKNVRNVLTFVYRLQPKCLNIIVNLLHYSGWYFYNVQLGKFEEISDMTEFLKEVNGKKNRVKNMKYSAEHDAYTESINFALEALKDFAQEDILPIVNDFNLIISFCLTHIHMKNAFDLLFTMSESLNNSFSSGSPECLWNACELLSRINSVQFDVLRFVPNNTETPLRLLQKRIVSIGSLLSLFIKIYGFIPNESEVELSDYLLLWGLSCGDLQTAATALNLYASAYQTSDETVILHIIESACIVLRGFVESERETEALEHTSYYICAIFRTIGVIVDSLMKEQKLGLYQHLFWLPVSLISVGGPLLEMIVDDALKLIIKIISNGGFDSKSMNHFDNNELAEFIPKLNSEFKDMKPVFMSAMLHCSNTQLLLEFIMQMIKLPGNLLAADEDFTLYSMAIAPYLCCSIEDPQLFSKICKFSSFTNSLTKLARIYHDTKFATILLQLKNEQITNPQTLALDLMSALNETCKPELFVKAAEIYSALLTKTPQISLNCIFDLCAGIMSVAPGVETLSAMLQLTREGTINQELGDFSRKMRFLQAVTSYTETHSISIPKKDVERVEFDKKWIKSIEFLQNETNQYLYNAFRSTTGITRIRFDAIKNYPPIFPFEKGFTKCKCITEVSNICRQIQVNPQSNWSYSIYCSQDMSEQRAAPDEVPDLDYSVDYEKILEQILEAVSNESNEEECENQATIQAQMPITIPKENKQKQSLTNETESEYQELVVIEKDAFLPSQELCDRILDSVIRNSQQ